MSDIKFWDPIDDNNTDAPPDGWPEGQLANTVNNCARAMMGAVRREWEDKEWFDWNDTITFISGTSFNVTGPGTLSDRYQLNRRVRAIGSLTGTIYGTITNTSGSFVVDVDWDAGSLQNETLAVALGAATVGPAISASAVGGLDANPGFIPIGGYLMYPSTTPPTGYLWCNGDAYDSVANTEYAALFAVIGTTFGGTGADNFQVPDSRGYMAIGAGDGGGSLTNRPLGNTGGLEDVTLLENQMPIHTHSYGGGVIQSQGFTGGNSIYAALNGTTGSAGGGLPHTNMPPWNAMGGWHIRYL